MQSLTSHEAPSAASVPTQAQGCFEAADGDSTELALSVAEDCACYTEPRVEPRHTGPCIEQGGNFVRHASPNGTETWRRGIIEHVAGLPRSPLHRDVLNETPDRDLSDFDVSQD